ncbi:hypothetical protein EAO69_05450, partial [Streptomyces sp. me109]
MPVRTPPSPPAYSPVLSSRSEKTCAPSRTVRRHRDTFTGSNHDPGEPPRTSAMGDRTGTRHSAALS